MKTIYLVTKGTYSDYHVVGAFSSRKKAKGYIDWHHKVYGGDEDLDIETYPVDRPRMPSRVYYAIHITEFFDARFPTQTSCLVLRERPDTVGVVHKKVYPIPGGVHYFINVTADSKERATKIGNEKIRQFQAENQ